MTNSNIQELSLQELESLQGGARIDDFLNGLRSAGIFISPGAGDAICLGLQNAALQSREEADLDALNYWCG